MSLHWMLVLYNSRPSYCMLLYTQWQGCRQVLRLANETSKQCQVEVSSVKIRGTLPVYAEIFHHILLTVFHFLEQKENIGKHEQQRTDLLEPLLMQDGTCIANIDAVVYCTGYQYAYPFLEGTSLVTSYDMRVDPLWQHIFPPNVAPTLSFVGLIWKSLRNPQFELQVSHSAKCKL
jgi:hypothetical protein